MVDEMANSNGLSKDKAHSAITKAIRLGILVRPEECEWCFEHCKPEAHHDLDDKPLDVQWLCKSCHVNRHKEIKKFVQLVRARLNEDLLAKAISVSKTLI